VLCLIAIQNKTALFLSIFLYFFLNRAPFDSSSLTPALQQWRAKGHYHLHQTSNNTFSAIFYVDQKLKENPKSNLLLIHGFPTASYDWKPIWNGLEISGEFDRIITLDLLGFGFSDKPLEHSYSILEQADIIYSLMNSLHVSQFHIMAHDYGVSITQELLARDIESPLPKIQSVCLLNGGLFPETHRPRLVQKLLLNSFIGPILSHALSFSSFARSFSEVFGPQTQPSQEELGEIWAYIRFNNGDCIYHRLITYINERIEHRERWVNALQKAVNLIPIILINGPIDPVSGLHMAERYKELVTDKNVIILNQNIGHYPQLEDPETVLKEYLHFMQKKTK